MPRPFEHIRHPKIESQLIAADEEKAALIGGGQSYATSIALERLAVELGSLGDFRRRTRLPLQVRRSPALRALQDLALREDFGRIGGAAIRRDLSSALLVQCISDVIASGTLSNASSGEHGMALVADVKTFLGANADREIPLNALADRFGISRRHITRLFREGTGQSIAEFQPGVRLEQAERLLCETGLPVGAIAFRVGFESGAALARAMRRVLGRSPSEIRFDMARAVKN